MAKSSSFNPLQEGMPLDKQTRSWRDLTAFQYNKQEVHPYTRTRIITVNGIEVDAAIFADGSEFVPVDSPAGDHRYHAYQAQVNAGMVLSQEVVKKHISQKGEDYRFVTAPPPVKRFQDRKAVPEY